MKQHEAQPLVLDIRTQVRGISSPEVRAGHRTLGRRAGLAELQAGIFPAGSSCWEGREEGWWGAACRWILSLPCFPWSIQQLTWWPDPRRLAQSCLTAYFDPAG